MKLSILIPAYNEAPSIEELVRRVHESSLPHGVSKEVIVIDDGSTDGSREILARVHSLFDVLITRDRNQGKGAALKDGLQRATGEYVLIQDADLEYDPRDYSLLLRPVVQGDSRVVFGSRFLRHNPRNYVYAAGNILATMLFNVCFRTKLTDLATCYKLFPASLVPHLLRGAPQDFVFDVVYLTYCIVQQKLSVQEVPIRYAPRPWREKKLKPAHGVRIFKAIAALKLYGNAF